MTSRFAIFYVNNGEKQAAILNIDQEKAFDKIEWKYVKYNGENGNSQRFD